MFHLMFLQRKMFFFYVIFLTLIPSEQFKESFFVRRHTWFCEPEELVLSMEHCFPDYDELCGKKLMFWWAVPAKSFRWQWRVAWLESSVPRCRAKSPALRSNILLRRSSAPLSYRAASLFAPSCPAREPESSHLQEASHCATWELRFTLRSRAADALQVSRAPLNHSKTALSNQSRVIWVPRCWPVETLHAFINLFLVLTSEQLWNKASIVYWFSFMSS